MENPYRVPGRANIGNSKLVPCQKKYLARIGYFFGAVIILSKELWQSGFSINIIFILIIFIILFCSRFYELEEW